jgi:hypothetical protein
MKDFLYQLAMPQSIKENPCSMDITLASFISFWKKAKENITCYPSKLKFATLKASSADIYLVNMDCIMTQIPLCTGYLPMRWQRCVDVMIQKKIKYD